MAITMTLPSVRVLALSYPDGQTVAISYALGFTDVYGMYHDVLVDGVALTCTLSASGGNPLPAPTDLATILAADVTRRYGAAPDSVTINGVDYPVPAPPG